MDWVGWAIFGLLATAVLTAVMIGAQLSGSRDGLVSGADARTRGVRSRLLGTVRA